MAYLCPHLLWLLFLQLPLFTSAQPYQNVTLGSSLSSLDDKPYWTSPSGEFAFGFYAQGSDLFLLAIWFVKMPLQTVVWSANKGKAVEGGCKVQLTTDGLLSLSASNGTSIWKSETLNGNRAAFAAMLNTGNFVLISDDFTTIWESFKNPTDTILLTQTLDLGGTLISQSGEQNYTRGRFKFYLQPDRNLCLYPLSGLTEDTYDAYWCSTTVDKGVQLVFNNSGFIYVTLMDGSQYAITSATPVSTTDFYHKATLDFDGVFRQYTYPKSPSSNGRWSQSWSVALSIPQDICAATFGETGSGACGFNSYCKLENNKPTCECPPGYIYFDPNDIFKGCKQTFVPQSCETEKLRGIEYVMQEIPGVDWYKSDYAGYRSQTDDWCSQTCLNDCLCAAAITRGGECWLKKFPLSNGVLRTDSDGKALIKTGNSSKYNPAPDLNFVHNSRLVSIILGSSTFLNLLLFLLLLLLYYCAYHKKQFKVEPYSSVFGVNIRAFTYKELQDATNGFKEELGHGASSVVYKGRLQHFTESFVAVKRLSKVEREVDNEFRAEVSAISRTNHKNLVQLLGFCDEETNQLLVYQYMKNGSLADFLFGSSRPDWTLRIQIAFQIARGLAYLHEDCSTQIIHCDVKPQNILLDDSFRALISDFGLAKLLKTGQTRTDTNFRGTRGYVAPEWFKNTAITTKVDVFSFGIVLLEIICCRRNVKLEVGTEDVDILSEWAYECCLQRKVHLLVENEEAAKNDSRLERFFMVAIWCVQEDPFLRPSMKNVTQMLELKELLMFLCPPDAIPFSGSSC